MRPSHHPVSGRDVSPRDLASSSARRTTWTSPSEGPEHVGARDPGTRAAARALPTMCGPYSPLICRQLSRLNVPSRPTLSPLLACSRVPAAVATVLAQAQAAEQCWQVVRVAFPEMDVTLNTSTSAMTGATDKTVTQPLSAGANLRNENAWLKSELEHWRSKAESRSQPELASPTRTSASTAAASTPLTLTRARALKAAPELAEELKKLKAAVAELEPVAADVHRSQKALEDSNKRKEREVEQSRILRSEKTQLETDNRKLASSLERNKRELEEQSDEVARLKRAKAAAATWSSAGQKRERLLEAAVAPSGNRTNELRSRPSKRRHVGVCWHHNGHTFRQRCRSHVVGWLQCAGFSSAPKAAPQTALAATARWLVCNVAATHNMPLTPASSGACCQISVHRSPTRRAARRAGTMLRCRSTRSVGLPQDATKLLVLLCLPRRLPVCQKV